MLTVICDWTQVPNLGLLKRKALFQTPAPSILTVRAGIVPNHMRATEKVSRVDNGTAYVGVMQQLS